MTLFAFFLVTWALIALATFLIIRRLPMSLNLTDITTSVTSVETASTAATTELGVLKSGSGQAADQATIDALKARLDGVASALTTASQP